MIKDSRPIDPDMSEDRTLKSVIVGCGMIAGGYDSVETEGVVRTHALAYRLHQGTELVAVADVDEEKARNFAARWEVNSCYQDVKLMLQQEGPELVSICTPDQNHVEMLKLCLNCDSVLGVWCEKPVSGDPELVRKLLSQFSEARKTLIVNYPRSYLPSMKKLKSQIVSGQLGTIQKVVVYYSKGIVHNGSHAIDLLVNWWGPPSGLRVLRSFVDFTVDDPTVDALLEFEAVPVYLVGLDDSCYSQFEIEIFGSTDRVSITQAGKRIVRRGLDPVVGPGGNRYLSESLLDTETEWKRALALVLDELVTAIRGCDVSIQGDQIVDVTEICSELAQQGNSLESGIEK